MEGLDFLHQEVMVGFLAHHEQELADGLVDQLAVSGHSGVARFCGGGALRVIMAFEGEGNLENEG